MREKLERGFEKLTERMYEALRDAYVPTLRWRFIQSPNPFIVPSPLPNGTHENKEASHDYH